MPQCAPRHARSVLDIINVCWINCVQYTYLIDVEAFGTIDQHKAAALPSPESQRGLVWCVLVLGGQRGIACCLVVIGANEAVR